MYPSVHAQKRCNNNCGQSSTYPLCIHVNRKQFKWRYKRNTWIHVSKCATWGRGSQNKNKMFSPFSRQQLQDSTFLLSSTRLKWTLQFFSSVFEFKNFCFCILNWEKSCLLKGKNVSFSKSSWLFNRLLIKSNCWSSWIFDYITWKCPKFKQKKIH